MLFSQELQRRGMHICGLPDISIVFIMFKTWGGSVFSPPEAADYWVVCLGPREQFLL